MSTRMSPALCDEVEAMRRRRYTQGHIAHELGLSRATVSRILKKRGLSLLSALEPEAPRWRYEREAPGEIIHIDIKKPGRFSRPGHRITGSRKGKSATRGVGWEYVHVAVDDHSRVAFTAIHDDEKQDNAVDHLRASVAHYASPGVTVTRVMTDNGACYRSHSSLNRKPPISRLGLTGNNPLRTHI